MIGSFYSQRVFSVVRIHGRKLLCNGANVLAIGDNKEADSGTCAHDTVPVNTKQIRKHMSLNSVSLRRCPLDAFINWFRGLSRNAQVAIAIATLVFMPAVVLKTGLSVIGKGIAAFFSILWFIGGKVNWGVALAILCGYGMYRVYVILSEDGDEDENNDEDDSWLRY